MHAGNTYALKIIGHGQGAANFPTSGQRLNPGPNILEASVWGRVCVFVSEFVGGCVSVCGHHTILQLLKYIKCYHMFIFQVPCNAHDYVKAVYGENWFSPQEKWYYVKDSKNKKKVVESCSEVYYNFGYPICRFPEWIPKFLISQ